jgi:alpha-galactosidase/6-phospho-beta-glucosidase family protein
MDTIILTVIGGGSVNWMRFLMKDVYLIDEIKAGEIRLVDPNTEHIEAVAAMLHAFNRMRKKSYEIRIMKNLDEALQGANFVLTTFSPGAMDAFWNDLEIPIKYGIRQPVSMTVGPGGISAAIRTIPVAYELVEKMEECCPGAFLLNVTNPMSVVTRAMNMAARTVKVIGFCHEFHALETYIGPMLNLPRPADMDILHYLYRWLPEQGLNYTIAGINHFIWITKAELHGRDVLPVIRQYCLDHREIGQEKPESNDQRIDPYVNRGAAKFALCRQFGYLPIVGDRHLIEFYPSLCNIQNGYGMKYGVLKTTVDSRRLGKVMQLQAIRNIADGREEVSWHRSGEEMAEVMRAILTNGSTTAIANLPNRGQITNLPEDVVVETLMTIEAGNIIPKMSGHLPGPIATLTRLHVDVQELTVKAALQGNRDLLIEAMSLDPSSGCADFSEIPSLVDDLLNANRQWLPRFFH